MNKKGVNSLLKQLHKAGFMSQAPRFGFAHAPDHGDPHPEVNLAQINKSNPGNHLELVAVESLTWSKDKHRDVKDYFPADDLGFERNDVDARLQSKADHQLWYEHGDEFAKIQREEHKIVLKTQHLDYEKMLANAPKKPKDCHDGRKGPLDVEVPFEKRSPQVADRLGHPEYLYNNIDKFLLNEPDLAHPAFNDQPFVQKPSVEPDQKLNFQGGEVIYENLNVKDWIRFWKLSWYSFLGFWYQNEKEGLLINIPVREDNFWWQEEWGIWMNTNVEFQGWDVSKFYDHIDPVVGVNIGLALYAITQVPKYALYNYAIRLRYSQDKQLLFVTRCDTMFTEEEKVYEMEHLEFVPPTPRSATPFLAAYDMKDGLMDVFCLNTKDVFTVYLNNRFWDLDHKSDFVKGVTNLWRDRDFGGEARSYDDRREAYFKP